MGLTAEALVEEDEITTESMAQPVVQNSPQPMLDLKCSQILGESWATMDLSYIHRFYVGCDSRGDITNTPYPGVIYWPNVPQTSHFDCKWTCLLTR